MSNVIILKDKLSKLREIAKTVSPQYDERIYQLNPVIENTVLEEFEKRYQIRLPEDYRDFLLYVGNGGTGIFGFHGIGYEEHFLRENLPDDVLKKPFLWSKAWQPQTVDEFEEVMSRIEEPLQGSIFITEHGCSLMGHLVVSGTERGNIWVEDFGSGNGIWPKCDFFEWYNTGLDIQLANWFDPEIPNHFQSIKAEIQARIPLLKSFGENVDIIDIYLNYAAPIEIGLIVQFQSFYFQKIKEIETNALQDRLLEMILSLIKDFLDDANNIYNDNFLAEENGYKKFKLLLSNFDEKGTPCMGGYAPISEPSANQREQT